jgi:hypothetical protein
MTNLDLGAFSSIKHSWSRIRSSVLMWSSALAFRPRSFGNIWRHFGCNSGGGWMLWHLVGRDQWCCGTSCNVYCSWQRTISPKCRYCQAEDLGCITMHIISLLQMFLNKEYNSVLGKRKGKMKIVVSLSDLS